MNTYITLVRNFSFCILVANALLSPAVFAKASVTKTSSHKKISRVASQEQAQLEGFSRDISAWKKVGNTFEKTLSLYLGPKDKKAILVILKTKSKFDESVLQKDTWSKFSGEYVSNNTRPKQSQYTGTLIVNNYIPARPLQEATLDDLKQKGDTYRNQPVQVFGCVTEQESPTYSLNAKKHSWKTSFKLSKTCGNNEPSIIVMAQGKTPQSLADFFVDRGEWKTLSGIFKTLTAASKNDVGTLEYTAD